MAENLTRTDKEWHERRRQKIGSSDIAAILGVDPYRNAGDVWLQKTGRLEPSKDNEHTRRGVALEPAILSLFEMERQMPENYLFRGVYVEREMFAANLDAAVLEFKPGHSPVYLNPLDLSAWSVKEVVEAKSVATIRRQSEEPDAEVTEDPGWGPGVFDVPYRVLVQVMEQLFCSRCENQGSVPVFSPRYRSFGFEIKLVPYDAEMCEMIYEAGNRFWKYVKEDTPPPNATPTLDTLKRRRREPKSFRHLGVEAEQLWVALEGQKALAKQAAESIDYLKAKVIELLGDDEEGILPDGRAIRYMLQNGARQTDLDILEAKYREAYAECVTQPQHRVLRIAKAKVGAKKR